MYSIVKKRKTHILDDVAMVGDEKEGATVRQVDLHPNQAIGMPGQVVQRNALTKVNRPVIKSLPVSGSSCQQGTLPTKTHPTHRSRLR